jgi:hypothetical protein
MSVPSDSNPKATSVPENWYPPWTPRFWNGMQMGVYWQLLSENRFRIHPTRWPMTVLCGACSVANSAWAGMQHLTCDRKIEETELVQPPIFVIGHWRSGTTLMHELMALDPNLAFPTNYDAFVPSHSIVSHSTLLPLFRLLMPRKRPMDNMAVGALSPQEDDFALLSLNAPTPYRKIAFPAGSSQDQRKLDPANMTAAEVEDIRSQLTYFYKVLTIEYGKRLVLKSPPHTGRIRLLAEWFPGAKFVHLSRHPHKLALSTCRLWKSLYHLQAFQVVKMSDEQMLDYVCECKDLMYQPYFHRGKMSAEQLIEVRFEDFIADPVAGLSAVYQQLQLDGFDALRPRLEASLHQRSGHQTAAYPADETFNARIDQGWADYAEAFGYR